MNQPLPKSAARSLWIVAIFITATATLYLAQSFLLPLVFAGLLSFLLSPLVRRLERWRFGRLGAVLVTSVAAFMLIGGLTYLVTSQFLDLARSLPQYRSNLIARVSTLKTGPGNPLRVAVQTISEVTAALNQTEDAEGAEKPEKPRPARVEIVQSPERGYIQMLMGFVSPVIGPLTNTAVVIVLVIFMLVAGEDLRDRIIHLMGRGRLRVTTQAFDEAGQRISRYLRAQVIVNAGFGAAIAIGLYCIGLPNAVFWGLLGMVLRFLPYVGTWIATALPVALSLAIFPTWTQPLLTITLFAVTEVLFSNVVEPWVYGASVEISPLAVILSAVFWTWLWGPVGLVLATPLTVCLAVAGRHLPDLAFLHLLLSDNPRIAPDDRLFQRLIAANEEEAGEIVERHVREHGIPAAYDEVVLPALRSVEADFRAGGLSEGAHADALHILRQVITDLREQRAEPVSPVVLCIPASHEGDEVAALMLANLLTDAGVPAGVLSAKLLAAESVEEAATLAPSVICISSLPPASSIAARALCKRLLARMPSARIVVGRWEPEDAKSAARQARIAKAGTVEIYSSLRKAAIGIAALSECAPLTAAPAPVAALP